MSCDILPDQWGIKYQGTYVSFETGLQVCQYYGLHEVIEQLCKIREENTAETRTIPSLLYVSVPRTQTDWEILAPEDFGRQPNVVLTFGPIGRESMKVPAQQNLEDFGEKGPDESDKKVYPHEEAMDGLDEKAHEDPDDEDMNNPDEGDIDNLDEDSLDEDNLEHASAEVLNDVNKAYPLAEVSAIKTTKSLLYAPSQKRPRFMTEKIGGNTFDFYSKFSYISIQGKEISIRKADSWVNATHLLKAANSDHQSIAGLRTTPEYRCEVVRGHWRFQGTYVSLEIALKLCQLYGLQCFIDSLQRITSTTCEQRSIAPFEDRRSAASEVELPHILPKLHHPEEPEQISRAPQTCQIPPLPHLSAISIDSSTVQRDDSSLPQIDRHVSDQVGQNTEPLLYTISFDSLSQQSHLSQVRPSFGLDESPIDYTKFLDEQNSFPLLGTESTD